MENTITERISSIIKSKGMSMRAFAASIDFPYNTLNQYILGKRTTIDSSLIVKTISSFDDISSEWLLTGKGQMLKENTQIQVIHEPKSTEMKLEEQSINLYDIAAAANLRTLLANKTQNILGVISIPDMPKCDGAVCVTGDSMYPLLKSGDIIAYKELHDFNNVIYGEMYLVSFELDGDEFLVVKYVNRSDLEGHIKLVSYNTHHDPKDIPISSISAMALVKLSIRKNVMI